MSNFASDLVTASHAVEKGTGCESRAIPLPCVLYNTPTAFISTVSRERLMGRIAGVGTSRKTCQVLNAAKNLARTRWQSIRHAHLAGVPADRCNGRNRAAVGVSAT